MVDAAKIHAADRLHSLHQTVHAGNVTGDEQPWTRITGVARVVADATGNIVEYHLHLRRHRHSIEIFLPVAAGNQVVDEHDEANVERLAPADDDLTVDQAVVDPVELNCH